MRSKMEYSLQVNEKGKQQPVKLGLAPVQRDDTEYEFDIVLDIARDHVATASKDVTFLDTFGQVITPELGQQLAAWLNDGVEPIRCEKCGHIVHATTTHTAKQFADGTKEHAGKVMCPECFAEWRKAQNGKAAS